MKYGTRPHSIICLSSQRWDETMWTNKQHIMSRLAADGHRVLHVDYGTRSLPDQLMYHLKLDPSAALRPLFQGAVKRAENLWVATSWGPPAALRGPMGSPLRDFLDHDLKRHFIRSYLSELEEDPIVWVYHPGMGDVAQKMARKLLVYDCVDDYQAFPAYKNAQWLLEREARLCKAADVVVTTSQRLLELKQPLNPQRTFLAHNVGDAEHFERARSEQVKIPQELETIRAGGPVVGFVGAVSNYKLNLDWLLHASKERPDWQFVLIGPVGLGDPDTDVEALATRRNVHLLGARAYAELPAYMKGFDVTVIPYRINPYTESVFPIKFFESLATGKPLVVSNLPALRDFYEDVLVASDAQAFVARCAQAIEAGEQGAERRVEIARAHSWPKRIGEIMGHIEDALDRG